MHRGANNRFKLTLVLSCLIIFLVTNLSYAQDKKVEVEFKITDIEGSKISDVAISLQSLSHSYFGMTDDKGYLKLSVIADDYLISFFHLSYTALESNVNITKAILIRKELKTSYNQLQEVIITAEEGKGLSSKSVINRKAMEHLQPSSFADIMELLPGGLSKDPNLNSANRVLIREFGNKESSKYNTSSLGVQFVMDGNVMNSNVDLQNAIYNDQRVSGSGFVNAGRETSSIGVDMRTIPTNDIESIEIVRGIPGVSYGDLTSGLILINRKSGATGLQGRIKADGFSKSIYVGKGLSLTPSWDLNLSVDYLNAKTDPRNIYDNYNRFAFSARSTKTFKFGVDELVWKSFVDFNLNIDESKVDPDSGYALVDSYKNDKKLLALSNNFEYKFRSSSFFNKVKLTTGIRKGFDNLSQRVFVQYSGPRAVSLATEQGVNDGYFPEISFISDAKTEGRPIDINTKLEANAEFNALKSKHSLEFGMDYKYAKNNGRGQIYDLLKPPSASLTTRPRAYSDIPAYQNLAFFIGDKMLWNIDEHQISFYAGIRASTRIGMDKSYSLSDKLYIEPRFIGQWKLPRFDIINIPIGVDVTVGYGELYKQPTQGMLYPNLSYKDHQQLNFRPDNSALHYVNFMTYVEDVTNRSLVAAKNTKKEIRLDLSVGKHELFFTVFDEAMPTGFRSDGQYQVQTYNRYNTSGLNLEEMTEKPNINDLPYTKKTTFTSLSYNTNGSSTAKRGIEFGYTTPRFKGINTKFTLSGAYFKTIYQNNDMIQERPNKSINGQGIPYVGIYNSDYGYVYSGMNYNLIIDTYLPALDMNISGSFQGTIFKDEARQHREAAPLYYFGLDQVVHDFTKEDRKDMYKQWLVRDVSITDNIASHYNFDIRMNLKVTKKIFKDFKMSLFVNRLFSYYSPYTFNGLKVYRKNSSEPYFGMELTYKF